MSFTFIDLFAGGGGFSIGATDAGGELLWACNHDPTAVEYHARHFPNAKHALEDVRLVDFCALRREMGRVDLIVAGPSCTGHTKARGKDRPHHKSARSTAWCVLVAAEAVRPKSIIVENVPEFASWALYPAWEDALRRMGYSTRTVVINAADAGVPQSRLRMFVIATKGRVAPNVEQPKRPHVFARSIVRLDDTYKWKPIPDAARIAHPDPRVRPLADNTKRRIEEGRRVHGHTFLTAYYGNESGGRSLNVPLGTVTTRDRHAIIRGDEMRMLHPEELRAAMSFPDDFDLPKSKAKAIRLLGNAVPAKLAQYVVGEVMR